MRLLERNDDLRLSLRQCGAFSVLPLRLLDEIVACCEYRQYDANERLIEQGAAGDSLMILCTGRAEARLRSAAGSEAIASFSSGDIVGEMALVTGEPRSADVVATEEVLAVVIPADAFDAIARRHPTAAVVLTRLVADRLGATTRDGLSDKSVDCYRIERCVGRGGMAVVYRAVDTECNDVVALKMMSHSLTYEPGAIDRFHQEADLLLELDHQHIARVQRRFPAYGTNFIVMEFCGGRDLHDILARDGPMPERRVRCILGELAGAIHYLHGAGVLHRDIKPSNVMLTADGSVRLTDFGLARPGSLLSSALPADQDEGCLGTPQYMAPEQLRGKAASPETDVYSFGCLALALLIGTNPFPARSLDRLFEQKRGYVLPARRRIGRGVSCRMHRLLRACLATDPAQRRVDLRRIARWAS